MFFFVDGDHLLSKLINITYCFVSDIKSSGYFKYKGFKNVLTNKTNKTNKTNEYN
jgi:hypothetical protein